MNRKFESVHYPFDLEELPAGWEAAPIMEVTLDVQPGFACGKHNKERIGIPHLRPMNINPRGEIDLSEVRYVQPDNPLRLSINDILFNNTNSPAWVGKTAIIQDSTEFAFSNHMTRLRVPKGINPEFLAKQLHYLQQCGYFLQQCTKHVNQASISSKFLRQSVPFIVPPANEQQRIIKKITLLQAQSSKVRKALEVISPLLEKFRRSVLSSAFRGDLTADWRGQNPDIEPAEKLLERIRKERRMRWEEDDLAKMKAKGKTPKDDKWKDKYKEPEPVDTTDLPELPEGWCWATLSELSSAVNPIGYGVLQPGNEVEGGAKLVRVCDLEDGKVLTEQLRTISSEVDNQYTRTRLKGGELLVTVVGTIGRVAVAPDEIAGANVARAVARLTPTDPINASWLLRMLSSNFLQDWLVKGAREVARKTLNIGVLEKTPVPLCTVSEMQEGLDKVDKLLSCLSPLKKIAQENLKYISSLDQSILAKAFRGELVPQDKNDEPASHLLERIKLEKASRETGKEKRASKGRTAKIL